MCKMHQINVKTKLSNGLFSEALNELYVKKNKIHHYPTRNCDKYHIQTSTDSFSNVSNNNNI